MTIDLLVPALGESVVEATVAKWMKSSGDNIKVDEPIIELETDMKHSIKRLNCKRIRMEQDIRKSH